MLDLKKKKKRKKSFNFQFFKTVLLGNFLIWPKNTPKLQKLFKNVQNHQIAILSFTFHQKDALFVVDLFSQTFDMEVPTGQVVRY